MGKGKKENKRKFGAPGTFWPASVATAVSTMLAACIIGNLTYALTDSFGMSAGIVTGVIGISKVFDGLSDLIAGIVIDKTKSKYGKSRIYDLMIIPTWIAIFLCFNIPQFGTVGKAIWLFVMYNLYSTVCYTMMTVAMPLRYKRSYYPEVRSKAIAASGIAGTIVSVILGIIYPVLIARYESVSNGWNFILILSAIPAILLYIFSFFTLPEVEETVVIETVEANKKNPWQELVSGAKELFSNPQVFLVMLILISTTFFVQVASGVGNYFYKYVYGDLSFASIVSLFSLVGYLFLFVMPVMQRKLGNRKTLVVCFTLMTIGSVLKYFCFNNSVGIILCQIIAGAGVAIASTMGNMLVIDCMEYGQAINKGSQSEAIYSSVTGLANKIAQGVATVGLGIALSIGGYDGSLAVQPDSALSAMKFLFAGLPALFGIIGLIALKFYNLDSKLEVIRAQKAEAVQNSEEG